MKKYLVILGIVIILLLTLSYQPPQFTGYLITSELQDVTLNSTKENSEKALNNSELIIQQLLEDGFSVSYFNDTLIEAQELFNKTVYNLVLEKYQEIVNRKERAYTIRDNLRALELRIQEISEENLNVEEPTQNLEKAKTEFKDERYDRVEKLIIEGNSQLNTIEAESRSVSAILSAAKDNLIDYIKANWPYIVAAVIILGIIGFFSFRKYRIIRTGNKIEDLKLEKNIIGRQIKKTQEDYFKTKKITKQTYDIRMEEYQKRLNEIKEKLPVMEKRLKKMKSSKVKI